jgi:dihydropteroate synthase
MALSYPFTTLPVSLPCLMGVLNVTPDSFSDGGLFFAGEAAVAHALEMAREGASIVDVGGESTRPGAERLPLDDELQRVVPVIEAVAGPVRAAGGLVSVDTYKAEVARRALGAGAAMVNDISALRLDAELAGVVAESGCALCLMHMQGEPRTMQENPHYESVVDEVRAFLEERLAFAVQAGVKEEQVVLDPGIGFGKSVEHNLLLIRHLHRLVELGRPVLLGASRKRFLGAVLGGAAPMERVVGTAATTVIGLLEGAAIFRVHDVRPNAEALAVARSVLEAGEPHRA